MKCDFCSGRSIGVSVPNPNASDAVVDGPTRFGPYAYMCLRHLKSAGYPKHVNNYWIDAPHKRDDATVTATLNRLEDE